MANRYGGDSSEQDVIPESILSISKDARYIQQCQELLQQSLTALFERKESLIASSVQPHGQERKQELQRVRKQILWMISCILYTLVSTTTGRTLGMEALGLTFTTDNTTASRTKTPQSNEVRTSTRLRRSLFVCLSMLLTATGSLVSEYFFKDGSTESAANNDGIDEGESGNQQQYQERSRGRERRLIHERLRRQMLERAAANNLDGISTPTPGTNTIPNQQSQQETELGRDNATRISRRATSSSVPERFMTNVRQLSKFIFEIYSNSDGPHNMVQPSNDDENNNRSTSYSIALWIVRLHLAQYLLTGKYPTLMHRFLGLKPTRERLVIGATATSNNTTASRITTILDRPTTNRAIAAFILLQASTSLVQNTSNWFTERVAKYLEARASKHRRSRDKTNNAQLTKAQLRTKLDTFFGNINNNSSKLLETHNAAKLTVDSSTMGTSSKRSDEKTATMVCTICRLERKNPAAPSACGHVCCWNCLIQWVSTVRPECPICRAPCSPKDVLLLHNYD